MVPPPDAESCLRYRRGTYEPQGARAWPESLPMAVLPVYDSRRQMAGVREQLVGTDVVLHCLEGQVAQIARAS